MVKTNRQYVHISNVFPLVTIYMHKMLKQKAGRKKRERGKERRQKGKSNLAVCGTEQTDKTLPAKTRWDFSLGSIQEYVK